MSTAPNAPVMTAASRAVRDVLAERVRQVAKGHTAAHDDTHTGGELADAAACMALLANDWHGEARFFWPFVERPAEKSPRDCLVAATAMLLADIERRDRAEASRGPAPAANGAAHG